MKFYVIATGPKVNKLQEWREANDLIALFDDLSAKGYDRIRVAQSAAKAARIPELMKASSLKGAG